MKRGNSKRGTLLVENIVFITLTLIFLAILILFLVSKMGSTAVLEEKYSKQIALIIDSARPTMLITLNMEDAIEKAEKKWEGNVDKIVTIEDNIVTVKLSEDGGYEYSFFNDVDAVAFPNKDGNNDYTGEYIITINENE